jgi:hypothetical protein
MHTRGIPGKSRQKRVLTTARRLSLSLISAIVLWGLTATIAAAAPAFQETTIDTTNIWPALLPLLAAAASVERAIEVGWNYIEWGLLRFAGWRPTDLQLPSYTQFKSGTSLLAGFFLGIVVANYTNMRLLEYLRPEVPGLLDAVPPLWDIILTGIVIGAGSKPAHDILGLITQLKNFTGNNALKQRELAGQALADGVLKLGQAEAPVSIEVPGAGPTAVSITSARQARERMVGAAEAPAERSAVDRYVDVIHANLY